MPLPNPSMSFSPFAILTAEEMNDLFENIEALQDGSAFDALTFTNNQMALNARPQQIADDTTFDFVQSGLIITGNAYGSTLLASLSAGVVYINGVRIPVSAVANRAYTASRDTYVDVGDDGVVDFNPVTNNNASPALAANHIRIGIVVTGASNIASVASINQGQRNKVLPIASSIPYTTTDSLGNLINPRDPTRRVLGYRRIVAGVTTSSTSAVQATGLTVPVIVPDGASVTVNAFVGRAQVNGAGQYFVGSVWDGAVGVGTQIVDTPIYNSAASTGGNLFISAGDTPTPGLKTYNVGFRCTGATANLAADPTSPAYIEVLRA